jgi:hypothetical protein
MTMMLEMERPICGHRRANEPADEEIAETIAVIPASSQVVMRALMDEEDEEAEDVADPSRAEDHCHSDRNLQARRHSGQHAGRDQRGICKPDVTVDDREPWLEAPDELDVAPAPRVAQFGAQRGEGPGEIRID